MRRPLCAAGVLAAAVLALGAASPAVAARGEIVFVRLDGNSVHRANPSGCLRIPAETAGVVNSTNARIKVMKGSCQSADARVVEANDDGVVFPWEKYVVVM